MAERDQRYHEEAVVPNESRTAAQVDRDRILYSPHFARLAEVTQVRAFDGEFLVHNRLTHSLKVGQLARRMAERVLKNPPQGVDRENFRLDPDVAEAAGLAHDLGHPPFGHIAEKELDRLIREATGNDAEGYEGNAQSFRILTSLTVSDTAPVKTIKGEPGANLIRNSLNAVLKYPWLHMGNPEKPDKWGAYATEEQVFVWARDGLTHIQRSIEAEIMDWADDITYAIHDLADFYCAGLIPLHLLVDDEKTRERDAFFDRTCGRVPKIKEKRVEYEEAFGQALQLCPLDAPYGGSQRQSRGLWNFCSELIGRYVRAILVQSTEDGRLTVKIDDSATAQTTILKQLTWDYVIQRSELATLQHGQRRMIRELFEVFVSSIEKRRWEYFPEGFVQLIETNSQVSAARWTADYISGLTERQVRRLYQRVTGSA
jgi:dGTPase